MELILLRHGSAEDSNPDGDAARRLIPKGQAQAQRAAKTLQAANLLPDLVLTSPLERALQTATIFCHTAALAKPLVQPWLAAGMHPQAALAELVAFNAYPRIAVVGHEPDLSALAEWLLDSHSGHIEIRKGALACLRLSPPCHQATLVYLLPPNLTQAPDP